MISLMMTPLVILSFRPLVNLIIYDPIWINPLKVFRELSDVHRSIFVLFACLTLVKLGFSPDVMD